MANAQGSQQTQAKKQPSTEILLTPGEITLDQSGFSVLIEVKLKKGSSTLPNTTVRIKRGVADLSAQSTDANGELHYTHKEPLTSTGKNIELRFMLTGNDATESKIIITLPESVKQGVNNPEIMTLRSHHDGNGHFTIFVRVMKTGGIGIVKPVVLEFDGTQHTVNTDDQGNTAFSLTKVFSPGEEMELVAKVSGIVEPSKLKLKRPLERTPAPKRLSCDWLLKKNNGRAILFLAFMVFLWGFCWTIGWGNPILNKPQTELSSQQKSFNEIASQVDKKFVIQINESENRGEWQKKFWFFAFIWTLFSFVYAPLSLREEIFEGLKEGLQRIAEKNVARTSDPLYERMASFAGTYSAARSHSAGVHIPGSGNGATKPATGDTPFAKLLASDLISDITVEVLPALFKTIFRK